jgi:hypothetical protein
MSTITPLESPASFDVFLLDGEASPPCVILSGGERVIEINDQGQPLTIGANSVVRMVKNITVTYGFKLWKPEHFALKTRWEAMLEAGGLKTNPRVYSLIDERVRYLKRVFYEGQTPQGVDAPGGPWNWKITLHEWKRIAVQLGPVRAPQNAVERAIQDVSAQNATLNWQLAAMQARQKAGKP